MVGDKRERCLPVGVQGGADAGRRQGSAETGTNRDGHEYRRHKRAYAAMIVCTGQMEDEGFGLFSGTMVFSGTIRGPFSPFPIPDRDFRVPLRVRTFAVFWGIDDKHVSEHSV